MEIEIKPIDLLQLIDNNVNYFDGNNKFPDLKSKLKNLKESVQNCNEKVEKILSFACDYDFDNESPGNGYRSFVDVFNSAIKKSSKLCERLISGREKILFRAAIYAKEINEWNNIFSNLSKICSALIETNLNSNKSLFLECDQYDSILSRTLKAIDQKPFYASNLGFQFCASIRPIVKFVIVSMASYFNYYYNGTHKFLRGLDYVKSNVKYLTMSKKRAERCVHVFSNSTSQFSRSFWFLNEGTVMYPLSIMFALKVEVNNIFHIQPEPLKIQSKTLNKTVNIPLPQSHIGSGSIACRLISAKRRKGMSEVKSNQNSPEPSKNLIFHVHGGAWASQSSKSHESYLRKWAVKLDVPILSIDYSLAPKAPFPRALEEVFYAYCWALKNPELVGWTGENVVFVGDSAGGNLVTACVIKCIEMGIPKPKGLMNIYSVFSSCFNVTPARFLSLIDSFLPYFFAYRLYKSYAENTDMIDANGNKVHKSEKTMINEEKKTKRGKPKNRHDSPEQEFDIKVHDSYLISTYYAPDEILAQFPPSSMLTANLDPFLDDSVEFAKKLKKLNVKTTLDIVKGLPHGFLYFAQISKESNDAVMMCCERIHTLMALETN